MQVGNQTTFTQIYNQMKPGLLENENKHIRGDGNGTRLYTHSSLQAHGSGATALANRLQKYQDGADFIKQALTREFGQEVADKVFSNLNLTDEVRLSDLKAIRNEARLVNESLSRLANIPAPSANFVPNPTTAAEFVANIHGQVETYVRGCIDNHERPDPADIGHIMNQAMEDFADWRSLRRVQPFADLSVRDRAVLLNIVDQFDVGPYVLPEENSGDYLFLNMLTGGSRKPIMIDMFHIDGPDSTFNEKKNVLFDAIASDEFILDALARFKAGEELSEETVRECIERVLDYECEIFEFERAPLEFTDHISSLGQFDGTERKLYINESVLSGNVHLPELLNIACHENLHNMQYQFMDRVFDDPDQCSEEELFQAQIFDIETRNYINSRHDQAAYMFQAIERPAMRIGSELKAHLNGILD